MISKQHFAKQRAYEFFGTAEQVCLLISSTQNKMAYNTDLFMAL